MTTVATTKITATAVASKRWEEQREAIEILLRRALPRSTPSISVKQKTPSYASPCTSLAAYSNACSCLGVGHTTTTASTPSTTRTVSISKSATVTKIATIVTTETLIVVSNNSVISNSSTKAGFTNSTALLTISASSITSSGRSSTLESLTASSNLSNAKSDKGGEDLTSSSSTNTEAASSSTTELVSKEETGGSTAGVYINSTASAIYANATTDIGQFANVTTPIANTTRTQLANGGTSTGHVNMTVSTPMLNATATGLFPNSTSLPILNGTAPTTQVSTANTSTALFMNATASTGLLNATSVLLVNATSVPVLNISTSAPYLNATNSSIGSLTTSVPYLNATVIPWLNTTKLPAANATSVHFSNTSSSTTTPISTSTLDRSCGETTPPFLLQVSHPSSLFDGWYAKVSGDQIMFTSSANHSDKFSVESSGHLCAVGYVGDSGNPTIAIVETKDGLTGSAIYFIDGQRVGNLTERGYGALDCAVDDDLACQARDMSHWVACGLGLDISNDGNEMVVVDSWNCTSVALSAVYS